MMKTPRGSQRASHRVFCCGRLVALLVLLVAFHVQAGPLVTTDSPIGFFTNIASRLLSAQMGLDLNHIQVYPTNQYTPAVHRVLQVTANLYDAATNRPFAGDYPFLPTVFRPLFRRDTDGTIFIAGYREVEDDVVATFTASGPTNVVLGFSQSAIPLVGTPFSPSDLNEPLVTGIPLVIGARKGLPNFNEFAMDTQLQVGRKLRFVRDGSGNIASTNAMFLLTLTNTFGFEAWNSYRSAYPRPLEVRMEAMLYALLTTNLTSTNNLLRAPDGAGDLADPVATYIYRPTPALIPTNTWQGGIVPIGYPPSPNSFRAVTQSFSWTNAQCSRDASALLPLPGAWDSPNISLPPGLFLTLRPLVRFALVDTSVSPGRIIDYVSLDSTTTPTNLMAMMQSGAQCGSPAGGPTISPGSLWCDNLYNGVPIGLLNQIMVNLGDLDDPEWSASAHPADIDFFRAQFGWSPLYYPGGTFARTNTFYTAYNGERPLTYHFCWQANDPLVHYTVPDLVDQLSYKPALEFDTLRYPAMHELGGLSFFNPGQPVGSSTPLNDHYRPWGGNPNNISDTTPLPTNWRLELKDPLVRFSDDWDFPTNTPPDLSWLGRVHRGTPWQTLYLKSSAVDLSTWTAWTGDTQVMDFGLPGGLLQCDAAFSQPTNDWRLAALLVSLLSTNDPRTLLSVNEPAAPVWTSALDGFLALTNSTPETLVRVYRLVLLPRFDSVLVQSNTPQAAMLAAAIASARASQPGQRFSDAGDILATPELSVASPFLNQGFALNVFIRPPVYTYQQTYGLSEAAYEALPAQLLPRLRPDSVASMVPGPGPVQVQFTGADGYRYAVEVSSDLVNWTCVSTNYPSNGRFLFQESLPATDSRRFYRSVLLP